MRLTSLGAAVDGKVYYSKLDGTGATLLISANLTDPVNLALDFVSQMMYITEVSERSERALMKTSILAMNPAKWLQT